MAENAENKSKRDLMPQNVDGQGLDVLKYEAGDESDRLEKVRELADERDDVRFSIGEESETHPNVETDEELVERRRAIDEIVPTDANATMAKAEEVAQKSISSSKEDLRAFYSNIGKVVNKKDGREVEFYKGSFDKNYRVGGLFAKAVPALKEAFENSILAYSEYDDKYAGTRRKDGSLHKAHPNVVAYRNYVGKVKIDGDDCYVRFTVSEQGKSQSKIHSSFVTNVEVYRKTTSPSSSVLPSVQGINPKEVVDAKLRDFFDRAKKAEENLRKTNGQEQETRFSIDDTASTLGRNLGKEIDVTDEGRREQDRYILDPETGKISLVSKNNRTAQDAERSGLQ